MPDQSEKSTCLSCWKTTKKEVDDECMRAHRERSLNIHSLASVKKEAIDKACDKAMNDFSTLTGQRYTGSWDFHPDCPDCGSKRGTTVTPTVDNRTAASNNEQQRVDGRDDVDKQSFLPLSAESVQSQKPDTALTTQLGPKVDSTIEPGAADDDWHEVGQEDYGAGNPESDDEDWAAAKDMGLNLW